MDEEYEKFQINDSLKHFFTFLESQFEKDYDIKELYKDVFIEF